MRACVPVVMSFCSSPIDPYQTTGRPNSTPPPPEDQVIFLTSTMSNKKRVLSIPWCFENFIQVGSLRRCQPKEMSEHAKKQMLRIMDRHKLEWWFAGQMHCSTSWTAKLAVLNKQLL